MLSVIGNKAIFALEFEILHFQPHINGRSAIWVGNTRIGNIDDVNILGPYMRSLSRITLDSNNFWLDEFNGSECKVLFYTIFPFYNDHDRFYKLDKEKQASYVIYDKFKFQFGENFDDWTLTCVIDSNVCKFLWAYSPKRDKDSFDVRNNIKCFDVPLNAVKDAYIEFCKLIPDQYWPMHLQKPS